MNALWGLTGRSTFKESPEIKGIETLFSVLYVHFLIFKESPEIKGIETRDRGTCQR